MLKFATLLLVVALVSGGTIPKGHPIQKQLRSRGRIIGGTEATIEANPWQVSLEAFGIHNCGGSIIGPDTILTAAHCIDGLLSLAYEVVSGTNDLSSPNATRSTVKEAIVHENYGENLRGNDVALIILNEPLTFDNKTQAVKLTDSEPADNDKVTVTGWGLVHDWDILTPNLLYTVDINIVNRKTCAQDYSEFDAPVDGTMLCAGEAGKDSCSGDSGGPMTKDGVQVGIVSWGYGCAIDGYPGVYTNVAAVRDWIRDNSGI